MGRGLFSLYLIKLNDAVLPSVNYLVLTNNAHLSWQDTLFYIIHKSVSLI